MTQPRSAGRPTFPAGLPVVLDPDVRRYRDDTVLLGGTPGRLLRLQPQPGLDLAPPAGPPGAAQRVLLRTLVDGGLAHPRPGRAAVSDVCVVVPVKDRAQELDACLQALGAAVPVVVVDDGSADPSSVAAACGRHGASLVRQERSTGPAGARNAGVRANDSVLVAFLDSDCVVPPGWLEMLLGHFADPAVGAVAPRVRARQRTGSVLERYARARGPLDLGPREARVQPGGRVAYVPTAALVVRRAALSEAGLGGTGPFDPGLRFGEDVDLVWRLHDAGWSVRYDPRTCVLHSEPESWLAWLSRKHRYGTSAAPLSQRHGPRLTPLVLAPWPTAAVLLLLGRRPLLAGLAAAVPAARLQRRLLRAGVPARASLPAALQLTGGAIAATVAGLGGGGAVTVGPLLVAGLASRRTRAATAAALVLPPLLDAVARRPALDPARWVALRLLDDLAYASGVWRGCWTSRTTAPLRPRRRLPQALRP